MTICSLISKNIMNLSFWLETKIKENLMNFLLWKQLKFQMHLPTNSNPPNWISKCLKNIIEETLSYLTSRICTCYVLIFQFFIKYKKISMANLNVCNVLWYGNGNEFLQVGSRKWNIIWTITMHTAFSTCT